MAQWGKVLATEPENLSSINPFHVALERQAGHAVLEQVRKIPEQSLVETGLRGAEGDAGEGTYS